ncbi:MAG: alpha/beta fold hydrolase [Calditrichaeota bacterium]|nr:MAG: alpha/beta fold hydrolase [Calditrichota bacterium]
MMEEIFIKRGTLGCLMVHGFTGSPNELKDLATFLVEKNITVYVPLLPGHGTYSADLFNYRWRDWFNHVKRAYQKLKQECEHTFVAGLSMGGTLALHLAAHEKVSGVISMAAAIKFPRWKIHAVKALKTMIKYRYKKSGEDVKDVTARARLGSYRRYPYQAVEQVFKLTEHTRDDLPEITSPILIFHSKEDHTVPYSNAEVIYNTVSSEEKKLISLENSFHVITVDFDREIIQKEIYQFIQSHIPFKQGKSTSKKRAKVTHTKK